MNALNLDLEPFDFDFELDEFSDEHEGSCSECTSELELGELETDLGDSEWEEEVRRRGRRFTRPLRRPRKIRPRPRSSGGALRPKPKPRPPWRPTRPFIGRPGRRRPVIIREPAAPCVCPAHGTEFVRWVQSSLNQVLGLRLPVNGVMNRATRDALRDFQKREGLPIDGIAGPETERALIAAKGGTTDQAGEFSELEAIEDLENEEWESEVDRSSKEYVSWAQRSLNSVLGTRLAVDGIIGRNTRSAIRTFQERFALTVDGIVGPQTEAMFITLSATVPPSTLGPRPTKESFWRMRPPVRYQANRYICWAAAISSWSIVTKGAKKFKTTESVLDHFRPTGVMNADDSLILPDGMEAVSRLFSLKFKKFEGGGSLSAINIGPLLKHSHLLVVFKRPGADYFHFVVVYGVDRFHICFMDPELNPAAPYLDRTKKNRVCARIDRFGAGATEFFVFWKERSGSH